MKTWQKVTIGIVMPFGSILLAYMAYKHFTKPKDEASAKTPSDLNKSGDNIPKKTTLGGASSLVAERRYQTIGGIPVSNQPEPIVVAGQGKG